MSPHLSAQRRNGAKDRKERMQSFTLRFIVNPCKPIPYFITIYLISLYPYTLIPLYLYTFIPLYLYTFIPLPMSLYPYIPIYLYTYPPIHPNPHHLLKHIPHPHKPFNPLDRRIVITRVKRIPIRVVDGYI